MWGATVRGARFGRITLSFNPRAPCGARPGARAISEEDKTFQSTRPIVLINGDEATVFQSTRPVRGATFFVSCLPLAMLFQSTRPVRDATGTPARSRMETQVSIHAPRAGRDSSFFCSDLSLRSFNPRAPCGARLRPFRLYTYILWFQSTRPVWGATREKEIQQFKSRVSIHASRVGRDSHGQSVISSCRVSIHAPRVGRDVSVSSDYGAV